MNVTQKLINDHLVSGEFKPGEEIGIRIDQTLTQDATGTMVMLELEAMDLDHVRTEVSAQYVDHNLIQEDNKNPDDHLFLKSACERFGIWYSRPGNGVSHPVHMERFGKPGKSLLGSDSHTCSAGSLGMLAIGSGGMQVALAMAGEPYYLPAPKVMGVKLTGKLPDWVSAKDVILEMLRRHGVSGGVGKIIEYYGPGLENLSAMDRHVIANMGAELGATTTVFPADDAVRRFLKQQGREEDFKEITADSEEYDEYDEIDLSELEPLIALPTSPGNVTTVREVQGKKIYQAYIGSSANPGLRDLAVPAMIAAGKEVHPEVSLDINPTSRQILNTLVEQKHLGKLIQAGARLHQAGCNGCIGMGQAPATGRISLRTVPRNFPGRSGTKEDQVHLCSPETAIASALRGVITDPRDLDQEYPEFNEPETVSVNKQMLVAPPENGSDTELVKGPNISTLPLFQPLGESLTAPVMLVAGDDVSTDEILPAGTRVLPYRSNISEISRFTFERIDDTFYEKAMENNRKPCIVVGGKNYGQGSSCEHAALAPRYLGVAIVLAQSFARIHRQNLVNFGILPLLFNKEKDYKKIEPGVTFTLRNLRQGLEKNNITLEAVNKNLVIKTQHDLTPREINIILEGGLINTMKKKLQQ